MRKLLVKHGQVVTPENVVAADLYIENGQLNFVQEPGTVDLGSSIVARSTVELEETEDYQSAEIIDASGCYVTPGLFDLQVNGCPECNLWLEPAAEQFNQLCELLLRTGVTAFMPTLITDDLQHLQKNIRFLESMGINGHVKIGGESFMPTDLIAMPGIHLEGPYLSPDRCGVHPKQYVRPILMEELNDLARPSVKIMTLAPELEKGWQAIDYLRKKEILPSLGHSNATFNEAMQAFSRGITMVTHVFNAMPPMHHRQPGAALAALLASDVYCCVIADGLHVDSNMIKLLIEMKGMDKVVLVTDMASVGTADGGLVGSSIVLSRSVLNLVNWGLCTFPQAIKMATFNPAKAMDLDHCLGQIKEGRRADLVIWQEQTLAIKHVIANGVLVF